MTNILDLPVELRLQIYKELVLRKRPYKNHPWGAHLLASWAYRFRAAILGVSRQINQEAMKIFYGMNQLRFYVNSNPRRAQNLKESLKSLKAFRKSLCFSYIQQLSFDMYLSDSSIHPIEHFWELLEHLDRARVMFDKLCSVLSGAPNLRVIEIAWIDGIRFGQWSSKRSLLQPLGRFSTSCAFKIDEIEICFQESPSEKSFMDYLQEITGVAPTRKASASSKDPSCLLKELTI